MLGDVDVAADDFNDVSVDDLDVIAGDADVDGLDINKTNVDVNVDDADSVLVKVVLLLALMAIMVAVCLLKILKLSQYFLCGKTITCIKHEVFNITHLYLLQWQYEIDDVQQVHYSQQS